MRAWAHIAIVSFLAGQGSATADAQKPIAPSAPPAKEQLTLEKFGDADKSCHQWSDGCAVCKRADDGSFGCSITGIACQPAKVECRRPDKKPADAQQQPKKGPGDPPP